jgi:hypothetical protein
MAETLISPGVLARENDQSFVTSQPAERGAAIIGPTLLGPVERPTLVSSFSSFQAIFGGALQSGSNEYTYLTSIAANQYFQNGGNSLLVTRVTSGSFSPASSSYAQRLEGAPLSTAANFVVFQTGTVSGSVATHTGCAVTSSTGRGAGAIATVIQTDAESVDSIVMTTAGNYYNPGDQLTIASQSLAAGANGTDLTFTLGGANQVQFFQLAGGVGSQASSSFQLETISEGNIMNNSGSGASSTTNGALVSGSVNNVRWEVNSVNTSSGTFSLLIRRGNDTHTNKVILEQYNNISLDPFASNYISRAIGDVDTTLVTEGSDTFLQESGSFPNISAYVRVKSVNNTPNYFNNDGTAKNEFTGSMPVVGSGSFGGAVGLNTPTGRAANYYTAINNVDTQGLIGSDYNNAIALLADQDSYSYNVISVPGLNNQDHSTQITSVMNNTIARGDAIAVIDLVKYNQTISTVVQQAGGIDNSYTATYWPWLQTVDPNSGQLVFIPASTFIPGVYAFTDASADPWFAPAGITRGGMGQVVRAERRLTSNNRDTLYEANVNPIATFPQQGVVVFGQKTLQKAASALDRVNVRRLLITLKDFISQIADNLVFEQNTIATRQNFLTQVNPYLESVQQRQGLFAFKVVMDESNNTPDVIDRNELIGQIFLQPTRTAEFIILDFNVLPTGATFPA